MRKLIESTYVSLGGVIGDPQVWGPPYLDTEHGAYANDLLSRVRTHSCWAVGRTRGLRPHIRR